MKKEKNDFPPTIHWSIWVWLALFCPIIGYLIISGNSNDLTNILSVSLLIPLLKLMIETKFDDDVTHYGANLPELNDEDIDSDSEEFLTDILTNFRREKAEDPEGFAQQQKEVESELRQLNHKIFWSKWPYWWLWLVLITTTIRHKDLLLSLLSH